ncbi:MAG: tryptophan halogenase, partial [Acidimicrobiales bacterium]
LHYCATERTDSPFWEYCKNMEIPDTLKQRIELYKENARLYRHDNELFGDVSWFAVLHGQNINPKRFHPNTNMMPENELNQRMSDIRKTWNACLDKMPMHQDFINQNCKAV